ncbi:MAG TPA: cupin domain-containing protein [Noviherbaspirillum sp.]|uniref:cupin domain-containing protein n=1 Tax=Noviherbaspirillum sp. TaxID=1926288 RepID=UPI002B48B594|nr:cupin domain-containing protein [Noviherbaspirillum sp.]HJV88197.1 cupin domain-containing protein [Noviherbaspirillum sp.]
MASMTDSTDLQSRLVRYRDLRPCTTAFIDTKSPGSDRKENFTIIGPGVAENPAQYVHITEKHGFNIGGARQPPKCKNSVHSHETAEVFMIHSGIWRFVWGEHGDAGSIVLKAGDVISLPARMFRGFENIGDDTGFMFAILGGDDPGRVLWAGHVLERAKGHGLILLEGGRLIDTSAGEKVPDGAVIEQTPTPEELARITIPSLEEMKSCILTREDMATGGAQGGLCCEGVKEYPVIGMANASDGVETSPMAWPHGFTLRTVEIAPGAEIMLHRRHCHEVWIMYQGEIEMSQGSDGAPAISISRGDTFTVPIGVPRSWRNRGKEVAIAWVVRGNDDPGPVDLFKTSSV